MFEAELQFVHANTYRIVMRKQGEIINILEFSGASISNGFDPFKFLPEISSVKITAHWFVDFGRAKKPLPRLIKAILQHPVKGTL